MKICTVVGARPQFIKAAAVSRVLRADHQEVLIHTGQHYDADMSDVFFQELGIPQPGYNLGIGSASHGEQTGKMLAGIERILIDEKPDWLLVYGDTNSTLAGALAAVKLHIPVVHVEAGLRSFNRAMPEEINRIATDHVSHLCLCPSESSQEQLAREGIIERVQVVGDVMADTLLYAAAQPAAGADVLAAAGVTAGGYILATVHRAENTDDPQRLQAIIDGFAQSPVPILLPLHPRTKQRLAKATMTLPASVRVCAPLGYFDLVGVARQARAICTDSGGLQKEAYWLGVPCLTLRDQTEWTETVAHGWNTLLAADAQAIAAALASVAKPDQHPSLYGGDGGASQRVVAAIEATPTA